MIEDSTDRRRKLSVQDYKSMRYLVTYGNHTIREVANEFGVSTKYVKKVCDNSGLGEVYFDPRPLPVCSGCGRSYGDSLSGHWAVYTSAGTKELDCGQWMPR